MHVWWRLYGEKKNKKNKGAVYETDNKADVNNDSNSQFRINICPTQYRIQTPTICSNFVWKNQAQQT